MSDGFLSPISTAVATSDIDVAILSICMSCSSIVSKQHIIILSSA